jgi:hypothetical protein
LIRRGLGDGGHDPGVAGRQRYALSLQGDRSNKLPYASLDATELAEDDLSVGRPIEHEGRISLQSSQHGVESLVEVVEHMVVIEGNPVPRMPRRSAVADEDSILTSSQNIASMRRLDPASVTG